MKQTIPKFKAGERVILAGKEVTIERVSVNINKQPLYKIGEQWHKEDKIEKWYPPCPV